MDEWMAGWMDGWMDGWMADEWMNGWLAGWMDGWMDGGWMEWKGDSSTISQTSVSNRPIHFSMTERYKGAERSIQTLKLGRRKRTNRGDRQRQMIYRGPWETESFYFVSVTLRTNMCMMLGSCCCCCSCCWCCWCWWKCWRFRKCLLSV